MHELTLANSLASLQGNSLPASRLDHIARLSDGTGIFQHALYTVPNFHEGYCTDDNARAFLLCVLVDEAETGTARLAPDRLESRYLAFLAAALNRDLGRFRNFMTHDRRWLEEAGSEDSHGRALWALGTGAARARDEGRRRLAAHLFEWGLPAVGGFEAPRAWAFALLGIGEFLRTSPLHGLAQELRRELTGRLVSLWQETATPAWPWFEAAATYENARLCQALLLSGAAWPDPEATRIGLTALGWLATLQTAPGGQFRPIGCQGFCLRDGGRADFDQQPVEAQAMVAGCLEAHRVTGEARWLDEALRAFQWFLGRNDLGVPLYDAATGGCGDGLQRDGVSANQGAESSLAFQLALADLKGLSTAGF